ncbi:hypothetical protein DFP72DRAFT_1049879 [Ephemerocybe angulata]|uniref:Uncharacterized protein n=1 Tax=Ephemerocybe angulata TaxID=980116 RepID=A0A8H6HKB8_9AGAR|nr:hypothetical protein DFP72DRAFT_1049879 [Tulosesus angulatus]
MAGEIEKAEMGGRTTPGLLEDRSLHTAVVVMMLVMEMLWRLTLMHQTELFSAAPRPGPDKRFRKEFDKKGRARPTPGAALALAKRETAGIVPSQGKKVVF